MTNNQPTRRNFLQFLGLSAGSVLVNTNAFAGFIDHESILKLNPEQQEFMLRYGKWMDEFIEVIRTQKTEPGNMENKVRMIALTEKANEFNPELAQFMKDKTFSLIYRASIQRMSSEI